MGNIAAEVKLHPHGGSKMIGTATHGLSYTAEYRAWQTMRLRCANPKNRAWPDYGGRGIKVCARWLESVEAFVADMGPKPSPQHELDRIDNDGDYEPSNCRWTTRTENCRNRRSNRTIVFQGRTDTLAGWCERLFLSKNVVRKRLEAGWSAERALCMPTRPKAPNGTAYRRPRGAPHGNSGESNASAKLTWRQVRRLRAKPPLRTDLARVARRLGVTRATLIRILQGTRWREPDALSS